MSNLVCSECLRERLKHLEREFREGIPDAEVYRAFDSLASPARATTDHGDALCIKHWCKWEGFKALKA